MVWHPGPGHTRGDTIAWVEEEKVLFSGDLVEYEAGVYTGRAFDEARAIQNPRIWTAERDKEMWAALQD